MPSIGCWRAVLSDRWLSLRGAPQDFVGDLATQGVNRVDARLLRADGVGVDRIGLDQGFDRLSPDLYNRALKRRIGPEPLGLLGAVDLLFGHASAAR